jgi:hypothetical protein
MTKVHAYSDAPARRRSRFFRCAAVAILIPLRIATAQAPADSLAERLRRAEAAIAALQIQVAEQAQSGVQTRSRGRLELNGRVMMNAFGNTRRVNNVDNPQFVLPDPGPPLQPRGGGIAIRQTRLGLLVSVPEALGGSFTGDLDVDFYGGQVPSSGGRTFPLLRLRTARALVRWQHASLMLGQESPLISDVDPVSVTAVGTPAFAAAGNLWLWLPQVRAGAEYGSRVRFGLQGAVLAPTSGDPAAAFDTDNDLAERSQRPFLQGRASAAWGETHRSEIGCGVHQGWLVPTVDRVDSRALACDLMLALAPWLELRGEYFAGEGLRGLGGGGIGQNFTPLNEALRSKGGWTQVNVRPWTVVQLGAGCGGDHPATAATRHRNDVCTGYALLRPSGPIFFGAEYRRMRTGYSNGYFTNEHVTLATGFEF